MSRIKARLDKLKKPSYALLDVNAYVAQHEQEYGDFVAGDYQGDFMKAALRDCNAWDYDRLIMTWVVDGKRLTTIADKLINGYRFRQYESEPDTPWHKAIQGEPVPLPPELEAVNVD